MDKKFKCEKCEREFEKKQSYAGHRTHCLGKVNYEKLRNSKKNRSFEKIIGNFKCSLCEKEFTSNLSLYGHQSGCGKKSKFGDIDQIGSFICECGVEFKTKRAKNGHWSSCKFNPNYAENREKRNKYCVVKPFIYNDITFHSSWEGKYAKYLDDNGILWQRCKTYFEYQDDGKIRKYFPDFYLPETDEYVEIKGLKTQLDEKKWQAFPKSKKLLILFSQDLKKLGIKL